MVAMGVLVAALGLETVLELVGQELQDKEITVATVFRQPVKALVLAAAVEAQVVQEPMQHRGLVVLAAAGVLVR